MKPVDFHSCRTESFPKVCGMRALVVSAAIALLPCMSSCNLPGRADGIDPNPFHLLEEKATAANRDPGRISIPILRSQALEKRWGKPKLLVSAKGGYALRYQDPRNRHRNLTVFGSPDMFPIAGLTPPPYTDLGMDPKKRTFAPVEVQQMWQLATINGSMVRFCITEGGSGDQAPQISTETFRMTAPDGRVASYRIRCSSDESAPGDEIKSLLGTLSF
jgi:hypothetical protein